MADENCGLFEIWDFSVRIASDDRESHVVDSDIYCTQARHFINFRMASLASIGGNVQSAKAKIAAMDVDGAVKDMDKVVAELTQYMMNEQNAASKEKLAELLKAYVTFRDDIVSGKFGKTTTSSSATVADSFAPQFGKVYWHEIVGLESVKDELRRELVYRLKFKAAMAQVPPLKSILLYGPPGTGKTMLAAAVATESNAKFYSVSASNILSKWVGDSEKTVRMLFSAAREQVPSVIFIDEADGLLTNNIGGDNQTLRLVRNEILIQMSLENDGVLVIAATNHPWDLVGAVLRRFVHRVYVPLPVVEDRAKLFKMRLPMIADDDAYSLLALWSDNYSASDIDTVCSHALSLPFMKAHKATVFTLDNSGMYWPSTTDLGIPMKLDDVPAEKLALPSVSVDDVRYVMTRVKPSVDMEMVQRYVLWRKERGTDAID